MKALFFHFRWLTAWPLPPEPCWEMLPLCECGFWVAHRATGRNWGLCVVSGVTIFGVSERPNRLEQSKVWISMNITTCISAMRFYSFLIMSRGLLKIKQKCLDKWKVNCIQSQFKPRIPNAKRGQHVKEIKKWIKQGEKKGRNKMKGNNQNEIMCWTTSRARTSVASVSDVVN